MNNYAQQFRYEMESSRTYAPENSKLHEIIEKWEKDFPDDKNLYMAKAIITSGNLFVKKEEILDLISKGEYATMYDSANYTWFYDTAMSYYQSR